MQGHFAKHCVFFLVTMWQKFTTKKNKIGLDVANLVIFIPKNGEKIFNKNHKIGGGPFWFLLFFPLFFYLFYLGVFGASSIQAPENHMRQSPQQH